jgi:hypothetical protein
MITRDTILSRAQEVADLSVKSDVRLLRKLSKDTLLAEHIRLLDYLKSAQQAIDYYIDDELEQRQKKLVDSEKKYRELYLEEHIKYNRLLACQKTKEIIDTQKKVGRPKISDRIVDSIRTLRHAGKSIRGIAQILGISTTTVQVVLRGQKF